MTAKTVILTEPNEVGTLQHVVLCRTHKYERCLTLFDNALALKQAHEVDAHGVRPHVSEWVRQARIRGYARL